MFDIRLLKQLVHAPGLSKTDRLLLAIAVDDNRPKSVTEIRDLAVDAGARGAKTWNISALLASSRGKAIRTDAGWELGPAGLTRVQEMAGRSVGTPSLTVAVDLRALLPNLRSVDVRAFVEEAIACYESKLYRAAVVLSWVGALSLIYDVVVRNRLTAFNTEAARRDQKWRHATTADDLARMKEHDFLQVAEAISVIGKSVKAELEVCLRLRNGCGHPNSLKVGAARVQAHIETLLQNVFAVFL